jgi:hypothetical protein
MCWLLVRTKIAYENIINVLESFGIDLSLYHLAGIRWTANYHVKYVSLDTSDSLRDAFGVSCSIRCSFYPVTMIDGNFLLFRPYHERLFSMQKESACSTSEKSELADLDERICVIGSVLVAGRKRFWMYYPDIISEYRRG